jgi:hypothetical protein
MDIPLIWLKKSSIWQGHFWKPIGGHSAAPKHSDPKVDAGRGPDRLSVRQSIRGRWLGWDCGDTPPLG